MRACARCFGDVADDHRFCPWCAAPLRVKIVEFFAPPPWLPGDRGKMLRVSRYVAPLNSEPHIRFSVWGDDGIAKAAISLGEHEADRLVAFIAGSARAPRPSGNWLRDVLSQLR